jgi:oligopeptidase A
MSDQPQPSGGVPDRLFSSSSCLPYGEIEAADVLRAAHIVVEEGEALLARLEATDSPTVPPDLMDVLEHHHDRIDRVYNTGHHFLAVNDTPAWREAWAQAQPLLTAFLSRWGQSRAVYETLVALRDAPGHSPERLRLLESMVLDMELAGVALEGEARERFRANQSELAALSTRFGQTALDARKEWFRIVTDPAHIDGMPANWRRMTASLARERDHANATPQDGPWCVTLAMPVASPVLQHCRYRPLREEIRRRWLRVGADEPHNNSPTVVRILELRREQARLLGFDSYIDLSMARKMAGGRDRVEALIDRIVDTARAAGQREVAYLQGLAQAAGAEEGDDWQVWDERFWAERDLETCVGVSDDDLRPYFAFGPVRDGLFALVERLFGVRFELRPEMSVWHPDVDAFAMLDAATGEERAYLYIDPYTRPETKRAGAWMMPLVGRSLTLGVEGPRKPAAAICCNQTPPVDGTPSLMSFREVGTLFHEMGHALHQLVSEADDVRQAGVAGVEWDAVELPSMFLDSWVYHEPTLKQLARHHETGEALSDDILRRLVAARTHLGATQLLGQASYTRLDFAVHDVLDDYSATAIHSIALDAIGSARTMAPLPEDRMLCSFSHLFAGGYAAGYYSYMWAGVLARDAFKAFTDLHGDVEAENALGRRWRDEVLAPGGSVHPMVLFERFRGRGPDVSAMLAWYGVDESEAQ